MKDAGLSSDRISTLPPAIIETILCLLPLKVAGRTSILSKSWRYSWNKIPKLVFNVSSSKNQPPNRENSKLLGAVSQVLSLHHGPIYEFTLVKPGKEHSDEVQVVIDQIIAHLLCFRTVKKLHVQYPCNLPVYVYLLDQLKYLHLKGCAINHLPTFNGFCSLTSLYLEKVEISKKALMHIVSNNPLLKSFTLLLKHDGSDINDEHAIFELFKCLPLIEDFTASDVQILTFAGDAPPRVLPILLTRLKYICIKRLAFNDDFGELDFLFLMLRSSPSLERLKLEVNDYENNCNFEDYSDIWLDRLVYLEIRHFTCSKPELEFVKLILANSPMLKQVLIFRHSREVTSEEVKVLRFFLNIRRASPVVKIIVD